MPVFTKQGVLKGVIDAKDILKKIVKDPELLEFVAENVKRRTPITAPINALVKDIFHKFKEKAVSRMMLVDAKGALAGIVTRGDLMHAKMKPTSKMRFSTEGRQAGYNTFTGEKRYRKDEYVRKYYTVLVDSLPDDTAKSEIIKHLITSSHDSVVLVDKNIRPTGFLSTRNILQTLTLLRPQKTLPLSIRRPSSAVSESELARATKHLELFGKRLKKRMEIEKIELSSKEPRSAEGRTKTFNITLIVTPISGQAIIASTKQRKFIDGVQEATKLIEKQYRRSGV